MKQGTRRTRTAKLDTGIDAEIAAAEAKLKSLRERKKEDARKFLESNQNAILALLREHDLDRVPIEKWRSVARTLLETLTGSAPEPVSAEPAKFEEWSTPPERRVDASQPEPEPA